MVVTIFQFEINEDVIGKGKRTVHTQNAKIDIISNIDEHPGIEKAEVTILGPDTEGSRQIARNELIKVLLTSYGTQARVLRLIGSRQVPDDTRTQPTTVKMEYIAGAKFVAREGSPGLEILKVNVNASGKAETAILQYYEALTKDHPVDRYREMFKVIEFLSSPGNVVDGLNKGLWSIPPGILSEAISKFTPRFVNPGLKLAVVLVDTRDKWSHLKEGYGSKPSDSNAIEEVKRVLPMLESIAKHSLETNPTTRI